jgi:hypothetical protein
MGILGINVGIKKLLLSLLIQGRYMKYFLLLMVFSLKCMFHLQDINIKGKMHNRHGNHLAKGDIHPCFPF